MAINFMAVQELVEQYNNDPRSFTDQEAEMVAGLASSFGLDFQRTSKPLQKAAFDAADMATLGLLPNEWRPEARGDFYLGESGRDKIAGGIGTVGGLLGAGGLLKTGYKGAAKLFGRGIISAPNSFATVAIFSSSVETNIFSILSTLCAISIAYASKGLPHISLIFLPGTPLEPPRANINANVFMLKQLSYLFCWTFLQI